MKTFKIYLNESIKQYPWNNNPDIGWWLDKDLVTFYHGTHKDNLEGILKSGIYAPSSGSTKDWVSLALSPYTAIAYASMSGGETTFRTSGSKAINVPMKDRVVIILKIPQKNFLSKMAERRGNIDQYKNRLIDKDLYIQHKGDDVSYYDLTEIRLPKKVDRKYIVGWMDRN